MSNSDMVSADPVGKLFDLSPKEAELFEEFCNESLSEVGVDGRQFFARLRGGETFAAALGLPDEIIELIYTRAHRWFSIGRFERAEPMFRALCFADGRIADYWVGLGVCLRLRDDLKGAALAFSTASALRPDWAVPVFHACELAMRSRDFRAAEAHIKRFRELADDTIPEVMHTEIARMQTALEGRRISPGREEPSS